MKAISFETSSSQAYGERRETTEKEAGVTDKNASEPTGPKRRGWALRIFVGLIAIMVVSAVAGIYYRRLIAPYESTDDAFISADVTMVAPQVAGRVVRLMAKDNEEVNQSDLLLEIDPRDYQAKMDLAHADLKAAKGRLEQADAQVEVDQARVAQEKANVTAADAEANQAESDLKHYQGVGARGVSQIQIDLAATKARCAAAQVEVALNKKIAAEAQVIPDKTIVETAKAEVLRSEATLRQAELNLSYTRCLRLSMDG